MSDSQCAKGPAKGRAYCGHKTTSVEEKWAAVTCENCLAARRADKAAEEQR